MNKSATMSKNYVYTYEDITSAHLPESVWDGGEAWNSPDTNTLILHLPFVGQNLDFSVRLLGDKDEHTEIEESENDDVAAETYRYPEMYMGIDAICRLIPEFAERF